MGKPTTLHPLLIAPHHHVALQMLLPGRPPDCVGAFDSRAAAMLLKLSKLLICTMHYETLTWPPKWKETRPPA